MSSIGKLQGTALVALAVASIIGGVAFFAAPVEGSENPTLTHNQENIDYEATESSASSVDIAQDVYHHSVSETDDDVSASNNRNSGRYDDIRVPKRCYLVVGFDDVVPAINPANTIVMPASICIALAEHALRNGGNLLNE